MQYLHGRERNVSSWGCHWHNLSVVRWITMSRAPWSGWIPCNNAGGRALQPKYLPLGHEACSTRGEEGKCHYKSQLRNHGHRLEQVGDQKGVIVGTCVDGLRAAGQASSSYRQSKKDEQVFYERGPHGTCYTCAWQAPSVSQHVPMWPEVGIGPGRSPILLHCQWPCSVKPRTHALEPPRATKETWCTPSRPGDSNGVTEGP